MPTTGNPRVRCKPISQAQNTRGPHCCQGQTVYLSCACPVPTTDPGRPTPTWHTSFACFRWSPVLDQHAPAPDTAIWRTLFLLSARTLALGHVRLLALTVCIAALRPRKQKPHYGWVPGFDGSERIAGRSRQPKPMRSGVLLLSNSPFRGGLCF